MPPAVRKIDWDRSIKMMVLLSERACQRYKDDGPRQLLENCADYGGTLCMNFLPRTVCIIIMIEYVPQHEWRHWKCNLYEMLPGIWRDRGVSLNITLFYRVGLWFLDVRIFRRKLLSTLALHTALVFQRRALCKGGLGFQLCVNVQPLYEMNPYATHKLHSRTT